MTSTGKVHQTTIYPEFIFSDENYIMDVDWQAFEPSQFDIRLQNSWTSKESLFRYKLEINESKKLDGCFDFFTQLNVNRAVNRRDPEDIQTISQPFSHDQFNFTKIDNNEVMFSLLKTGTQDLADHDKDFYLINVSPLENYHSLLCPSLFKCLNQVITRESLIFAINTLFLSGTPEIRVGFNSLCGYATVNHLHFHAYYLSIPMKLETIKVELLAGRCYILEEFPSKGFVFQLSSPGDMSVIVNDILLLTNFLTNENIAHNLYMTRGLSFERSAHGDKSTKRDVIRIFVWARTSSCGAKTLDAFNPALCELFGHLVIKTKEAYDTVDERSVSAILQSITHEPFNRIKGRVKELFDK